MSKGWTDQKVGLKERRGGRQEKKSIIPKRNTLEAEAKQPN